MASSGRFLLSSLARSPPRSSWVRHSLQVLYPKLSLRRAMNKTELIDAIAKDSGLSRADSARAIDSLIEITQKTLKKGDEVALTGFGKFSVVKRGARTGRNPQTGQSLKIKASKTPKFSPGASFKAAISGKRR
ncbi:MAG: HU family DNA-binding protein [Solirubrobacterales bacterium]